jgi:sulfoquinovose isomerase
VRDLLPPLWADTDLEVIVTRHDLPPAPDTDWLRAEADRLLTVARASRAEPGGFWWLDAGGRPDPSRGRQLWIAARMTHCFSLGHLLGRVGDAELADHGVAALAGPFRDAEHDGWFAGLGPDGPTTTAKTAYEHAFVLLAASSASVAGRPGAGDLLSAACALVERRFWDEEAGAVREEWNRDWTVLDGYRGANANMHSVEAFLAVADATGADVWRERAARIATKVIDGAARAHGWRIPEHFDDRWAVEEDYNHDQPDHPFRPYGVTPGHALEWGRLLLHLDAATRRAGLAAPEWLVPAAVSLFDRALADGWDDQRGGFVYTTDWNGVPVVQERFHWVVAEAIAVAAALREALPGEGRYDVWYQVFWDYARRSFVDPAGGIGWQHEVDADGTPAARTWTGRPDIYHALQATLIPRLPLAPTLATALRDGLLA